MRIRKRQVLNHCSGSPEYVVAHGFWQDSRRRKPSVSYKGERNPEKAFKMAFEDFMEGFFCEIEDSILGGKQT